MSSTAKRTSAHVVRSRGIGAAVGAMIGAGWMGYGLSSLSDAIRVSLGSAGLLVTIWLLIGGRRLIAAARHLPTPTADALAANRRAWRLFWINLAVEIVLLNLAVNLLRQPAQRIYWIPAISFVVGLHFLPMARFFDVPSYRITGAAMIGIAVLVALALARNSAASQLLTAGDAIANAIILWATAAWGIRTAERLREG